MTRARAAPQDITVGGREAEPGEGAGAPVDALSGQCRADAEALASKQGAAA
ncbi:hypothetical protein AB0K74_19365 [Streptomyces sp. NPDC056159]|uniref:hypothetical protein n=1 Tax=Streptomyces sp. NPDC056159 TaxID=3155537 RepID=UPI00343A4FC3